MLPRELASLVVLAFAQAGYYEPSTVDAYRGMCPGGIPSLAIDCDPKHPWPRCPPQTYCFATNSVDIGPYYCCPATPVESRKLNNKPSSIYGVTEPTASLNSQFPPTSSIQPISQVIHPSSIHDIKTPTDSWDLQTLPSRSVESLIQVINPSSMYGITPPTNLQSPTTLSSFPVQPMSQIAQPLPKNVISDEDTRRISSAIRNWLNSQRYSEDVGN